jgi:outer membrane protein
VADEATLRALDEQVRTTRELVDGGAVLRTDLLSIEVRQSEAQLERLRTDVAERLALAALRELLALPPDAALAVAEHGPVVTAVPASATDALARAYARRPEAAAARHAVERARIELAAARRAWLPRLDVETRVGATDVDGRFSPVDPNWTMGVALSADLFDGGLKRANVARALAALDLVGENDRRTLVTIAREVETAYLRLAEARARLDVVRRAHATAAEALALVTTQYRGGAATVTRYLETEGALARARAAEVAGGLDVARAEVEVARAIGDLAAEPPPGGAT